jgi:hypothetical protein
MPSPCISLVNVPTHFLQDGERKQKPPLKESAEELAECEVRVCGPGKDWCQLSGPHFWCSKHEPWCLWNCRRFSQPSEDGNFWLYGICNRQPDFDKVMKATGVHQPHC